MNLEGAVRLGIRKQFEAIGAPAEREEMTRALIAEAHARGKAINMALLLELDAVLDPADTRAWLLRGPAPATTSPVWPCARGGARPPGVCPPAGQDALHASVDAPGASWSTRGPGLPFRRPAAGSPGFPAHRNGDKNAPLPSDRRSPLG